MATDFLYSSSPLSQDGTRGFKNYGGSAIPAGTLVKLDTGNAPTGASAILGGVVATAATTDNAIGITVDSIPASGTGRVRMASTASYPVTAKGAITYGDILMPGSTSGTVSTSTAGKPTIGIALNTAADGDPCEVLLCGFAKNA